MRLADTPLVCVLAGRSPRWPKVRRTHLIAHPNCAACWTRAHAQVHHVIPFHVDRTRELDPTNLITLCEGPLRDHLLVGHHGNWSSVNPDVRVDAEADLTENRRREATQ